MRPSGRVSNFRLVRFGLPGSLDTLLPGPMRTRRATIRPIAEWSSFNSEKLASGSLCSWARCERPLSPSPAIGP